MESAYVFQQEQMYMDEMRGVSVVRAHFRYWGRSSSNERVPIGVSGISCDSGTKSSLGPDFYFTGSLIYKGKPTLGYVLLVPPMLLTVALACYARTLRNGTHAHCTDMGVWEAGSCSGTLDSDGPGHLEPLTE